MKNCALLVLGAIFLIFAASNLMKPSMNVLQEDYKKFTLYEYQNCKAVICRDKSMCPKGDRLCNSDAFYRSDCKLKNSFCQISDQEFQDLTSDDKLTENLYSCIRQCAPNREKCSPAYWEIFNCEYKCTGLPPM